MHSFRRLRGLTCAGIAFGLAAGTGAHAQSVYVAGSGNEFGTLDLPTGTFHQIGLLDSTLYGMGFTSDGTLYGVDYQSQLYQIDPLSGNETLVGAVAPDAAFTATGGGSSLYGLTGGGVLFSINPTDQSEAELNTSTGITPDGLLASSGGTLYATGMDPTNGSLLYRLGPGGAVNIVGSTGITDSIDVFGAGVFVGDTLYGFDSDSGIYAFDTGTGTATETQSYDLGTAGDMIFAAAFAPAAPEPSQAAALGLGVLGLGALGLRARRRRA